MNSDNEQFFERVKMAMAEAGHLVGYHGWSDIGTPWTLGDATDAELRCMHKAYCLVGDNRVREMYPTYESFKEQFNKQNPDRALV